MKAPRLVPVFALAAAVLAGCGSSSSPSADAPATQSSTGSTPTTDAVTGDITVLAAASLKESFTTLGTQFEQLHPNAKVTFSFAASADLATQITQGAPADVFASASAKTMDQVVTAGEASDPTVFVKNVMEIAVPADNPAKIDELSDLADSKVKVALCQAQVPCGMTAAKVFANAKLTVKPVTLEADVKATLTKVSLGEVDAGVVYVTDVQAAGAKVKGIEIPADVNASTSYPIAPLKASKNTAAAQAFVDYVLSADGQQVLAAAGFAKP